MNIIPFFSKFLPITYNCILKIVSFVLLLKWERLVFRLQLHTLNCLSNATSLSISEADYTLDESFWIEESPAGKYFGQSSHIKTMFEGFNVVSFIWWIQIAILHHFDINCTVRSANLKSHVSNLLTFWIFSNFFSV